MDHWGHDPWADDADADAEPPKQIEVATATKTAFSAAPALLNSFLDDAQWGSNDDDFGDWETAAADPDPAHPTSPDAPVPSPTWSATKLSPGAQLDGGEGRNSDEDYRGWGHLAHDEEIVKEGDNVVSETSDSATTVRLDDDPARVSTDLPGTPRLDEELSTRPSTSPSDVSHTEAPLTESPRTSFEDERVIGAAIEATAPIQEEETKIKVRTEDSVPQLEVIDKEEAEDEALGASEDDTQGEEKSEEGEENVTLSEPPLLAIQIPPVTDSDVAQAIEPRSASTTELFHLAPFELDLSQIDQLFPPTTSAKELAKAPEDPISTTSTRKAWYRLTRRQTMREYNIGQDDDNHVRVTWANSRIRSEVGKIVSRWAVEDRMSGRGHAAGSSFYWDQPPADAPITQPGKKSTIPTPAPSQPTKQHSQPLSAKAPAAFSWSSPPMANDPWRQDSPGIRSISSPMAAVLEPQEQKSRAVSVDLTPHAPVAGTHQEAPAVDSPEVHSLTEPVQEPSVQSDPWASLGQLDTSLQTNLTSTATDDEDEWGEMVESPAVSARTPTAASNPRSSSRDHTPKGPSSTQRSAKFSPHQTPVSRHASPIVRLKGAVSPTSSTFRSKSFVPISAVMEPIGPGVLKRANIAKAPDAAIVKTATESTSTPQSGEDSKGEAQKPALQRGEFDEFAAFESLLPQPEPTAIAPSAVPLPSVIAPPCESVNSVDAAVPPIVVPNETLASFPVSQTPSSPWFIYDPTSTPFSTESRPTTSPLPTPSQTPTDPWLDAAGIPPTAHVASSQTPTDPWFDTSALKPPSPTTTAPQDPWSSTPSAPPTTASDPWSNADFSIFESAPPPPAQTQTHNPLSPSDHWAVFNTPVASMPKIAPGTLSNSEQRRREEEDAIVAEIVRGLPDLGYMLR